MLGEGKGKTERGLQTDPDTVRNRFAALRVTHGKLLLLFVGMLAFKLACDLGYLWLSTQDRIGFPLTFSVLKYALGLLCCCGLFFLIRHSERKASTFFLYFLLLFQILPITTSYALADRSSEYYLVLILAFALCALVVGYTGGQPLVRRNPLTAKTVGVGLACIMLLIVLLVVRRYGVPSLAALNLFDVYELRGSGAFQLSKYENYLFTWSTAVILPAGIALAIHKRKYILAAVLCGVMLVLYLYSAHKTFLFAIPLVLVGTFWARRKNFYTELFTALCIGYLALVLLLWFSPVFKELIYKAFTLLFRRVLLVPANNKFHYFDYFTNNPKMGIGGIFPRWLIEIPNYYENIPYSYEISAIYYNQPEMNSNTGFLAEGFMRFGHMGTVLILLLFGWILKMIDRFQERAGYTLAIGVFIYQIYSLADAHLLDSLVLGPWMVLVILLLFCGSREKKDTPRLWGRREGGRPVEKDS